MKRIATLGLILMLGLGLALTGCTRVQKYAAAGGVVGAAIGGPWAHNSGTISTCGGVAIGAATGGLLGALIGDAVDEKITKDKFKSYEDQIADLNRQLAEKDAEIARLRKELDDLKNRPSAVAERIIISNDILYASGKANLTPQGKEILSKAFAYVKKNYGNKAIVVEGHTDTQPIKYSNWKSNWELGAARALGVLHYGMKDAGIAGASISAQTFGEFQPVADNGNADGRKQNRRSVITVVDKMTERTDQPK